jgi:predicted transcriptional regulator
MSDKQTVLEVVSRLPETATLDEINDEIATLAAVSRGMRAGDEDRVRSHEEVKRLVVEWTSK